MKIAHPKSHLPAPLLLQLATLTALFAACGSAPSTDPSGPGPIPGADATAATAAEPSQDERMAWWRDARFGMFVHWGLYAIPAGAWQGKTDYGEWIRDSAQIPLEVYERFQSQWNPTAFDADAWARAAKQAGMKYVVITSKHHDGFCLYDSRFTDWDIGRTPHGQDILQQLAAACERHGLRFCTYHSIMDWHHPDYLPRRPWETAGRSAEGADFRAYESYLHAQVTEIVQRYRPAVMWFDGEWENTWNHERGLRLWSLCRALDPRLIVNNRVDVHRGGMGGFSQNGEAVGDFHTPEQEIPATGLPGQDWESCMTMNSHWGWNAADTRWKSSRELVRNLIDIASKGGNYLLNVGPRADGTFPPEAVQRLQEIGAWMQRNGEAIHGTTASAFDALPWGRCTVKVGVGTSKLFLHVFEPPADGRLELPGLGNRILRAYVLGAPEPAIALQQGAGADWTAPVLQLPAGVTDPIATVCVVELEGTPIVYREPRLVADSEQFVHGIAVRLDSDRGGGNTDTVVRYTLDGSEPGADSPSSDTPVQIAQTATLRAATFRGRQRVSKVVARTFTKVQPLPPVKVRHTAPGLRVEHFPGDWKRVPNELEQQQPASMSTATGVVLPKEIGENIALAFYGSIEVPADDLYRFALTSDDGSKLFVDGEPVVDNDGLHGAVTKEGAIALGKGPHVIRVVWFNRTGGAELSLRWAAPGQPFAAIPAELCKH
jgi:alpha-L-fucosidase